MLGVLNGLQELLILLFWAAAVVVAGRDAYGKGRAALAWMILVALFPPLLIVLLSLGPDHETLAHRRNGGAPIRRCPSCDETIRQAAKVCPHCTRPVDAATPMPAVY